MSWQPSAGSGTQRHRGRLKAIALLGMTAMVLTAADASANVAPAQPAPDFALKTLAGPNLRLKEQRGQVVMVNFWATWCGPCRVEMPHLNKLYEKYRPAGFQLLGVNIDDDPLQAQQLAAKLGLRFPVLLDTDKKVSRLYDLTTMPSTVLIDRDGKVRYVHRGYRNGLEEMYERQIRELLKE